MNAHEQARRADLTERWKAEAVRLGFPLTGCCPAVTPQGLHQFFAWLEQGYHGTMDYLETRRDAYRHPTHVLPGARSLLMLALPYAYPAPTADAVEPLASGDPTGRISRYAWGAVDYHDLIHQRLAALAGWLRREVPGAAVRGVVDSAPLLEREFAQLAGLGWIGKHTLLLHPQYGSWFFLAALLTDVELSYDGPFATHHCGTCTACLEICPTDAFPRPFVLDARRCLSYLTIELRELPPEELRGQVDGWLFGCDLCQEVCPWNRKAPVATEPAFAPLPDRSPLSLTRLFALTDEDFRQLFRRTPLWRAKRRGLLRNAALILGAQRRDESLPLLERGLHDSEPLVRAACVWALSQWPTELDPIRCRELLGVEAEPAVRAELERVLSLRQS